MTQDDMEIKFDTFGYFLLDRYGENDLYVEVRSVDQSMQFGFHLTDGDVIDIIKEIELVLSTVDPGDLDVREYDSLEYVELKGSGEGSYSLAINLGTGFGNVELTFTSRKDVERLLTGLKNMSQQGST